MSLSIKRSWFLWLSWNTGTFLKHERSDLTASIFHTLLLLIKYLSFVFVFFFSSGVWWRYAGETLLSTSLKDRSEHRRHAGDRRAHGRLGWLLEWGMWEVSWQSCSCSMCEIIKCLFYSLFLKSIQYELQNYNFRLHSVNNFILHSCTGQVLSFLRKIHQFESNCCVCGRERLSLAERSDGADGKADSGEVFLYSPLKVFIFVALMCGMLVLMYFFYHVLGEWNS